MDMEKRDLLMKRKLNHSDAKSMDTITRFKIVANPNDLKNSMNLVQTEAIDLAQEEL